jgi:hypothetical protein
MQGGPAIQENVLGQDLELLRTARREDMMACARYVLLIGYFYTTQERM